MTHTHEALLHCVGPGGQDSKSLCCYLGTLLTGDTEALLACVRPAAVTATAYAVTWVHF